MSLEHVTAYCSLEKLYKIFSNFRLKSSILSNTINSKNPKMLGGTSIEDAKKMKAELARKLGRADIETLDLNTYELTLVSDVICTKDLGVGFEDIGGMDSEIERIRDNVVMPLKFWKMFKDHSDILPCPTGVLLYGKPGTGKTMMAKAIAKEAGATFINVKSATILQKWFGESDKLVSAIFSLGRILAPSVIFIDEIDTLLKKRDGDSSDSSRGAMSSIQGTFLSQWDGLQSSSESGAPVLVLGATNRIMDLDSAILRRMPVNIQTRVPDVEGRVEILLRLLSKEQVDPSTNIHDLAAHIAAQTNGYTGSDLKELARAASLQRVKDILKTAKSRLSTPTTTNATNPALLRPAAPTAASDSSQALTAKDMLSRPLKIGDFNFALSVSESSKVDTVAYAKELAIKQALEKYEAFMSKEQIEEVRRKLENSV